MENEKLTELLQYADEMQKDESLNGMQRGIVRQLATALAAATKIINALPKTADGVPIVPGMTVWGSSCGTAPYPYLIDNVTIDRGKSIEDDDGAWGLDAVIGRHETAVYSTEAAAAAGSEVKK